MQQPREVVSVMIRSNTFKMADGCGENASTQKNQNWGYYEAKCLLEIWADEEIQWQLSVMGRKQNIGRTLLQNLMKCKKIMSTMKQHK